LAVEIENPARTPAAAGFAGLAYFPFILVLLRGVVVGLLLLIANREHQTSRA
jgi:uncharacterized integral membrane protein